MIRTLFVLFALVTVAAQDNPRHDKYRDDPGAYCYNPKTSGSQAERRAKDKHAHQCGCRLMCQRDSTGEVIGTAEDPSCELQCSRTRCFCHQGEEPCEGN